MDREGEAARWVVVRAGGRYCGIPEARVLAMAAEPEIIPLDRSAGRARLAIREGSGLTPLASLGILLESPGPLRPVGAGPVLVIETSVHPRLGLRVDRFCETSAFPGAHPPCTVRRKGRPCRLLDVDSLDRIILYPPPPATTVRPVSPCSRNFSRGLR